MYLITGVAGFIGSKTALLALEQGIKVVGIDNLNNYYDVKIKKFRLEELKKFDAFIFEKGDIEDKKFLNNIFKNYSEITAVVNLAAESRC